MNLRTQKVQIIPKKLEVLGAVITICNCISRHKEMVVYAIADLVRVTFDDCILQVLKHCNILTYKMQNK